MVLVWQTSRSVDTEYGLAQEHRLLGQLMEPRSVRRVAIDIRPGTTPNTINLGSNGVVPLAVLSDEGFDANTVNPLSVTLSSAHVPSRPSIARRASASEVR